MICSAIEMRGLKVTRYTAKYQIADNQYWKRSGPDIHGPTEDVLTLDVIVNEDYIKYVRVVLPTGRITVIPFSFVTRESQRNIEAELERIKREMVCSSS